MYFVDFTRVFFDMLEKAEFFLFLEIVELLWVKHLFWQYTPFSSFVNKCVWFRFIFNFYRFNTIFWYLWKVGFFLRRYASWRSFIGFMFSTFSIGGVAQQKLLTVELLKYISMCFLTGVMFFKQIFLSKQCEIWYIMYSALRVI